MREKTNQNSDVTKKLTLNTIPTIQNTYLGDSNALYRMRVHILDSCWQSCICAALSNCRTPKSEQLCLLHDLISCSYLQHCVWSVITGHNSPQTVCLRWVTDQWTACDKSKPSRRRNTHGWVQTADGPIDDRVANACFIFTHDKGRLAPLTCHTVLTLKSAVKV